MEQRFKNEIIDHANSSPSEEVCGLFILSQFDGPKIIPLDNIHKDPENFFKIDPKDFIKFKKCSKILAIYHSHTDTPSDPSPYDKKISKSLALPFYIYSIKDEDFYLHMPETYQPQLKEREYVEDVSNCLMLVKNYYEQNFGLKCGYKGNFLEIDSKKTANLKIIKGIISSGFTEVDKNLLKKHDLILFKNFSRDSYFHLAVYDGEGNFFHHQQDRLSCKDLLDEKFFRLVYKVYRYKDNG